MKALIVLGGDPPPIELLKAHSQNADYIIAADAGYAACVAAGVTPDLLVGDLDSLDPSMVQHGRNAVSDIEISPCEKDETDGELALRAALQQEAASITFLGAAGGRIDHFLGNLMLLRHAQKMGVMCALETATERITCTDGVLEISGAPGDMVSIIPAEHEARVSATGLKYPLEDLLLNDCIPRGISNVMLAEEASICSDKAVFVVMQK